MDELIMRFEPTSEFLNSTTIALIIIPILALIGFVIVWKRKQHIIAMLLFFVVIIGFGSVLMEWLANSRIKPVDLYKDKIIALSQTIQYTDIKQIVIKRETPSSFLQQSLNTSSNNSGRMARLLYIDGGFEQIIVLSSFNYDIDKIEQKLRRLVRAIKQRQ